jgi:hypothetical protein
MSEPAGQRGSLLQYANEQHSPLSPQRLEYERDKKLGKKLEKFIGVTSKSVCDCTATDHQDKQTSSREATLKNSKIFFNFNDFQHQ